MPQKAIRGGTNCSSELHLSKTLDLAISRADLAAEYRHHSGQLNSFSDIDQHARISRTTAVRSRWGTDASTPHDVFHFDGVDAPAPPDGLNVHR